jgi:hypothetical protein
VSRKLQTILHRITARPMLMIGSETWTLQEKDEKNMEAQIWESSNLW